MESIVSQVRPLAVLWLTGFLQVVHVHRVISFCVRFSDSPHLICFINFGDAKKISVANLI
jgi:hypothetical protein